MAAKRCSSSSGRTCQRGIEGFRASEVEVTDLGNDRVLVVARYQGRGRTSDVEVDQRIASVYEIRDGMAVTVRDYESTAEALEAAELSK